MLVKGSNHQYDQKILLQGNPDPGSENLFDNRTQTLDRTITRTCEEPVAENRLSMRQKIL